MRLRGRKGIKEWLEQQTGLVVLQPEQNKGRWADVFGNGNPIHVELGMGKGRFISEMSAAHPEINFIGIDMYDELVRRACEKARAVWRDKGESDPPNLLLVRWNVEQMEQIFAAAEIERIYLNFSDPWPKKRHARRRLTHPRFVRKYTGILNDNGEIHFKTDSQSLFEFSLNSFADMGLRMRSISLDLHGGGIRQDLVMTEYEMKFVEQGKNIYRCEVVVGSKALKDHVEKTEQSLAGVW